MFLLYFQIGCRGKRNEFYWVTLFKLQHSTTRGGFFTPKCKLLVTHLLHANSLLDFKHDYLEVGPTMFNVNSFLGSVLRMAAFNLVKSVMDHMSTTTFFLVLL